MHLSLSQTAPVVRFLIAGSVLVATVALVIAVSVILSKRQGRIERRLAGYEGSAAAASAGRSDLLDLAPETDVVARAVDFTRGVAARAGLLLTVEHYLEQADVPLRSAEVIFYSVALAAVVFVLCALTLGALTAVLVTAVVLAVPYVVVSQRRTRRLAAFESQLPDSLNLLAGSMRAGFSFMQGLEAVADESPEPMRRELQRVFTEARLGRTIETALEDCARRMASDDLSWVVIALSIQREVGGNLAELLDTVAHTMTQRERLRREVKSLTAEGRFSAIVLTVMPFFFLVMFQVLQPSYVSTLFTDFLGTLAAIGALLGIGIGWFWLRKITRIEV